MKKIHIIILIVSVLIIMSAIGIIIYKNSKIDNDEMPEKTVDNVTENKIFDDVEESHWASEYISFVTQRNIMNATDDNNFYPDKNVSFGEFIETLIRASLGRLNLENLSRKDFVKIFEEYGILSVGEINDEKLNTNITKRDVAVLLAKVDMKIRNNEQRLIQVEYKDLNGIDEVSQTLIAHSISRGFFKMNGDVKFYPNKQLNRAEIAEIVYLFVNR